MPKYKAKIPTPDLISSVLQILQGQAEIKDVDDQFIVIELEEADEYALANTIRDLASEIAATTCQSIDIARPTLVEP
jgi:hypothetical protein